MPNNNISYKGRPIIFGEVLFDQFSKSRTILGGAPFNVAWHLQGFGMDPFFISRIGQDRLGKKVLESMNDWDMDIGGIQLDFSYPTGTVQVDIEAEEPRYTIMPEQAYDYIDASSALEAAGQIEPSVLYHGSLALRNTTSCKAWRELTVNTGLPIFTDINLRDPWWKLEPVRNILKEARWAKMNHLELAKVIQRNNLKEKNINAAASKLCDEYNFSLLIITLGSQGALLTSGDKTWQGEPVPVENIVDTVGAGDAFSAINIIGIIHGWEPPVILERSLEFASQILKIRGATTDNISLYNDFTRRWKM